MIRRQRMRAGILGLGLVLLAGPLLMADEPILLVHGLASSHETWDTFAAQVERQFGWKRAVLDFRGGGRAAYETWLRGRTGGRAVPRALVYALDFSSSQDLSIREQAEEVAFAVQAIVKVQDPGTRVWLVGHSMGGLAARGCVLYRKELPIAGVVTVGTPHSGSPLAFLMEEPAARAPQPIGLESRVARFSPLTIFPDLAADQRRLSVASARVLLNAALGAAGLPRLDSPAFRLLHPSSEELLDLNRLPWPPKVGLGNVIGSVKPAGQTETVGNELPAALTSMLAALTDGQMSMSGTERLFNDGIVPVQSQYARRLALAPYENASYAKQKIATRVVDAFHVALDVNIDVPIPPFPAPSLTRWHQKLRVNVRIPGETEQTGPILDTLRELGWGSTNVAAAPTATAAIDAIDLVFVIDTTASMRDDIDAVKQSATRIIDQIHAVSSSPRLAIVAYRDYTCEYLTRAWPFTADRDEVRRNIMALTLEPKGNPDVPEAVYEGLLDAIHTREIGQWRDGVKKVVILMGDAPPHSKKHTENEVVKAAEEVDPAHIFPIAVAGADAPTMAAFSALAHRTGGAMSTTAAAADLPAEIMRIVALGSRLADEKVFAGRVTEVTGDSVGIELSEPAPVQPGMLVLVFAADTPGLLVGEGPVVLGGGARYTVEMRAMYGTRVPRPGGPVRVLTKR